MTKAKIRVALMGGTGYAAAELIRRLIKHPNVTLTKIASIDHVGENIGNVHGNFGYNLPYIFENISAEDLAKSADLIFLALPHKISYQKVPEFMATSAKIIDLSGDYRIQDPKVYNKFYKSEHTNPDNIKKFVYGLPELNREAIKESSYIANPGCFPTSVALSLLPLAKSGLLTNKVRVIGPTGSSGSGVHPQEGTHHPIRSKNLKSYKPLDHQHQPEMEQTLRLAGATNLFIDFIPMSAPLTRGILTNAIGDLPSSTTKNELQELYQEFYRQEPFVRVCKSGKFPEVANVAGSNFSEVAITLKEPENGSASFAAIGAIDNLIKGASGQAIQNMNLMFGLDERAGIDDFGLWP